MERENKKQRRNMRTKSCINSFIMSDKDKMKMLQENRYITVEQFKEKLEKDKQLHILMKQQQEESNKTPRPETTSPFLKTSKSGFFQVNRNNLKTPFSLKANSTGISFFPSANRSQDNFYKTLGGKSSSNFFNTSMPKLDFKGDQMQNKVNEEDLQIILNCYNKGHNLNKSTMNINSGKSERDSIREYNKFEKNDVLRKYGIELNIDNKQKENILKTLKKVATQNPYKNHESDQAMVKASVSSKEYFKDPIKSFKKLHKNKMLYDNAFDLITEKQMQMYNDIIAKVLFHIYVNNRAKKKDKK
jgi:hypothetical protein